VITKILEEAMVDPSVMKLERTSFSNKLDLAHSLGP